MTRPAAEHLPVIALGGAIALVVGLALLTVGGPGQGRAERRDSVRYSDLMALRDQVACLAEAAGGTLPERLTQTPLCHFAKRYADPYSDLPYRYERASGTAYRLCAGFEVSERLPTPAGNFDKTTGCIGFTLEKTRR